MNTTLEAIARRYSCRGYTDEVPGDALLDAIAQAGIQAPSAVNRQHWQVILVKNQSLIAEMEAECLAVMSGASDKAMYERTMSRGGKPFYNAPCMIIVAVKGADGGEMLDGGIVAQNISIAATSLGVANLICGQTRLAFQGQRADEFRARLQIPQDYHFGISILLGFAKADGTPHTPDPDKITVIA